MSKITYEIVRHDGGWAYKVDETFSEAFRGHAKSSLFCLGLTQKINQQSVDLF